MQHSDKDKQHALDLPETLGYQFRKKREKLGYSDQDVADQLCLSISIIKKIEADQYVGGNNTVFMRGHIRSYARLLDISEKEVKTELIAMGLLKPSLSIEPVKFNTKQRSAKDKSVRIVTYSIIFVLIALVLLWQYVN